MSIPSPIDWAAVEDAIHAHFELATGVSWIWADQRAPQPNYPYGSLNILPGTVSLAVLDEVRIQIDGTIKIVGQRDFTVSAQVHVGPPSNMVPASHGRALMYAAVAALDLPGQVDTFRGVNLAVRAKGQPQDFDLEVGGEWISRTQADIRFGVAAVLENIPETDVGFFDKVEVSSTLNGLQSPGGSLELVDELFDPNA